MVIFHSRVFVTVLLLTVAAAGWEYIRWRRSLDNAWAPRRGVPEHATTIKYEQCRDLKAYLRRHGRSPSPDQIIAVHVLTHESMHMRGEFSEAAAECEAMQRDAWTARDLGASPSDAAALAVAYWRIDYPRMPDDYRSGNCRPGGELDEHLADGWPGE